VLPSRFKAEKAKDIQVTVQLNLTGDKPVDWAVTVKDQKIHAVQRIVAEPMLTFKASENVFLELVNGKISIENAFFSGKVNFKGDITVALKLKAAGFL
jgi:putative sterol carrier protein